MHVSAPASMLQAMLGQEPVRSSMLRSWNTRVTTCFAPPSMGSAWGECAIVWRLLWCGYICLDLQMPKSHKPKQKYI